MLGIELPVLDDNSESENTKNSTDEDCSTDKNDEKEKSLFKLIIPYKDYIEFEPLTVFYKEKETCRSYDVLKQNTWVDIINDAFLMKYKLPCSFIYKSCKVRKDLSRSKYFLTFKAKCKDCYSEIFGWSNKKPSKGDALELSILAKDTSKDNKSHISKRPLRGTKWDIVGT